MFVFWWSGRGYQTVLIWLVTMIAFGAVQAIGKALIPDQPWYWGLAFVVSALINWKRGTDLNARSLNKRQPKTTRQRLFYKAGHRFMSMPMETFSIILALAGLAITLQPLFASAR